MLLGLLEPWVAAFFGGIRLVKVFFYTVGIHTGAYGQTVPHFTPIHSGTFTSPLFTWWNLGARSGRDSRLVFLPCYLRHWTSVTQANYCQGRP